MSSFASAKGPSITVRFAPEYLTRQPFELGFKPEASSSTPAFCSSSWYFCISDISFSAGITPASESLLALTMIMNRIVFSVGLGARPPDGFRSDENLALSARRTRLREIDRLNELLLIVDRLVGRGPEIAIDRRSDRRFPDALGHEDAGHVLPGVGVPGRAVAAVPAVGPDGARPCFVSWATRSARRARVSLQPWFWPRPASPGGVVCRTVSFVLPPSSANVTVVSSSWPGRLSRIAVKTMRSFRTISRYTPWNGLSLPSGPRITKRYAPPVRKSISQPGSVNPCGPHHCTICSCSVHALHTSSRGASKTRVRIISPACLPSTKFFNEVPTICVQPSMKFFLANAGSFGKVSRPACVSFTLVLFPSANNWKVTSESPAYPSYRQV